MIPFFRLLSISMTFFSISMVKAPDPLVALNGKFPQKNVKKEYGTIDTAPFTSVGLLLSLSTAVPQKYAKTAKYWPGRCSGTVISPIHILTAAHCIVDDDRDATLKVISDDFMIRFYPSINKNVYTTVDEGLIAFGKKGDGWIDTDDNYIEVKKGGIRKCAKYKEWKYAEAHPDTKWDKPHDWRKSYTQSAEHLTVYDYAVLTLSKPIAESLVLTLYYDADLAVGDILYTAGYPGDKNPKYQMFWNKFWIEYFAEPDKYGPIHSNIVKDVDAKKTAPIMVDRSYEAASGQSGSMIYKTTKPLNKQSTERHEIVGVLSADSAGDTEVVRLTEDSIKEICGLMKEDDEINWKKQPGCKGFHGWNGNYLWSGAHASDINLLEEEYNELLNNINEEEIEIEKTMRLINGKRKRNKHRYQPQHNHFYN